MHRENNHFKENGGGTSSLYTIVEKECALALNNHSHSIRINNAKIQRYYNGKNVPLMSQSDLDPRQINLFLYASIPFVIFYQ